jgi:hypothetical protein
MGVLKSNGVPLRRRPDSAPPRFHQGNELKPLQPIDDYVKFNVWAGLIEA